MLFLAVLVIVLLLVIVCIVRYLLKKHWPEKKPVNTNNRLHNFNIIENPVVNNDCTESDYNHRSVLRKSVNINNRSHNINNSDAEKHFGESDCNQLSLEYRS